MSPSATPVTRWCSAATAALHADFRLVDCTCTVGLAGTVQHAAPTSDNVTVNP